MVDFLNLAGGSDEQNSKKAGGATDAGGLVFNLDDVEEAKGFEVLPKGDYNAVVDELEFGESSTNNPMFTVVYSITDAEHENRKVYDYWVLGGKGLEFGLQKLKQFLTRIVPEANLAAFSPEEFADSGIAIGRPVVLSLKIQTQKKGEYKGEKRNQVAEVKAATDGSFI